VEPDSSRELLPRAAAGSGGQVGELGPDGGQAQQPARGVDRGVGCLPGHAADSVVRPRSLTAGHQECVQELQKCTQTTLRDHP
jgi:hypothetical protein